MGNLCSRENSVNPKDEIGGEYGFISKENFTPNGKGELMIRKGDRLKVLGVTNDEHWVHVLRYSAMSITDKYENTNLYTNRIIRRCIV